MSKSLVCKFFTIFLFYIIYIYFSLKVDGLPCTSETTKKMLEMTHWQSNTAFYFHGISEVFNVADFCKFVEKGFCHYINISFASNTPTAYKDGFKAAVEEMKMSWTSQTKFPSIGFSSY